MQNLLCTPHGYYFRMRVPQRHHDYFKRREFKKSLKTSSLKEAQKKALCLAAQIEDCIQRLDVVKGYRMARLPLFTDIKVAEVAVTRDGYRIIGLETDPLHAETEAAQARELYAAAEAAHLKFVNDTPLVPVPAQGNSAAPVKLFAQLIEDFVAEKMISGSWKNARTKGRKQQLLRCLEYFGNCNIATITRADAMQFMQTIMKLPLNVKKNKRFDGMTLTEIATKNKGPTLAPKSVNMLMTDIASMFKWCKRFGYIENNNFEGLSVKETAQEITQRLPYTTAELKLLFNDTIFQQQKCEASEVFIPLIGLFTGARLNEICQLHTDDIKEIDGIWTIDINTNDEQKSVKTKDSRRIIPLHSDIISAGFIKYVQKLKTGRVFPNLIYKDGTFSADYTKRFKTVRDRAGIEKADFHSFRHLFSSELEKRNVPEHLVAMLLGHHHQQITFSRYGGPKDIERLAEIVNSLTFPITVPAWNK